MPELLGVKMRHFFFGVAKEFAYPCIVKQQPAIFIDYVQSGGAIIQDFPKLALVLGELLFTLSQRRDVVNPRNALASRKVDMATVVGDLRMGYEHRDQ